MKKKKNKYLPVVYVLLAAAILSIAVILALRPKTPEVLSDNSAPATSQTSSVFEEPDPTDEPLTIDNQISESSTTTDSETETAAPETSGQTTPLTTSVNPDTGRIIVDTARDDWNLIVVNAGRELPEGYVPELKEILGCGKYLDYRVAPHYEEMYYAATEDGIILTPYSAYRSYERQKYNYNNLTQSYMHDYNLNEQEAREKAATVILPPGTSEHNLGYAIDICGTESSFKDTKEYAWLQQHAHEYGFILRYTAEKQPITGIIPEPWHWRYVGVEYAEKIKNSGLCLEEYLDSIGVAY